MTILILEIIVICIFLYSAYKISIEILYVYLECGKLINLMNSKELDVTKSILFGKIVLAVKSYFPRSDFSRMDILDKVSDIIFMLFRMSHFAVNNKLYSIVGLLSVSINDVIDYTVEDFFKDFFNRQEWAWLTVNTPIRSITPVNHILYMVRDLKINSAEILSFCRVFCIYILRNDKIYEFDQLIIALAVIGIANICCEDKLQDVTIFLPNDISMANILECQNVILDFEYQDEDLHIFEHTDIHDIVGAVKNFKFTVKDLLESSFDDLVICFSEPKLQFPKAKIFKKNLVLIKEIGKGSYANVYATKLKDKNFAVKKFSEEGSFISELSIVSQLKHPNISDPIFYNGNKLCIVYNMAQWDLGIYCSVVKGIENSELIKSYTYQLASAISYSHSKKIAHLDIKPRNILIHRNGLLQLSDFGSAFVIRPYDKSVDLEYRTTRVYAPPECFELSESIEDVFAVDIWSFGCTILNMFMGTIHIENFEDISKFSDRVEEFLKDIEHKGVKHLSDRIDDDANDLICKMLRRKPSERITAKDVMLHPFAKKYADQRQIEVLRKTI